MILFFQSSQLRSEYWAAVVGLSAKFCSVVGRQAVRGAKRAWRKRLYNPLLAVFLIYALLYYTPLSSYILYQLEHDIPAVEALPFGIKGLILLGGDASLSPTTYSPYYRVGPTASRTLEFARLAKRYPHLKLMVTGMSEEIALTQKVFRHFKIPLSGIIWETRSRSTLENGYNSFQVVLPQAQELWGVVTSAYHIRRAKLIFESVGWQVLPIPVAYETGNLRFRPLFSTHHNHENSVRWRTVLKEWGHYLYIVCSTLRFYTPSI